MDTSALALLRDNNIPIVVFDVSQPSAIEDAAVGREIGTTVQSGDSELFP
jgi:uridylate kinase